jgi:dCTP deaminase
MYLVDREIRSRLAQLNIGTRYPDVAFDETTQIQPCSVDLRLDTRFWELRSRIVSFRPWRRTVIDLRHSHIDEVAPRRHWRQIDLQPGEAIDIKPGRMVLGRIYEELSVPDDCAGKIEEGSGLGLLSPGGERRAPTPIAA